MATRCRQLNLTVNTRIQEKLPFHVFLGHSDDVQTIGATLVIKAEIDGERRLIFESAPLEL